MSLADPLQSITLASQKRPHIAFLTPSWTKPPGSDRRVLNSPSFQRERSRLALPCGPNRVGPDRVPVATKPQKDHRTTISNARSSNTTHSPCRLPLWLHHGRRRHLGRRVLTRKSPSRAPMRKSTPSTGYPESHQRIPLISHCKQSGERCQAFHTSKLGTWAAV